MKLFLYVFTVISAALVNTYYYYFIFILFQHDDSFWNWFWSILGCECFPNCRRRAKFRLFQWYWFDGTANWPPTNRLCSCEYFCLTFVVAQNLPVCFLHNVFDIIQKNGIAKIADDNQDLKWWFDQIEKTILMMSDKVTKCAVSSGVDQE